MNEEQTQLSTRAVSPAMDMTVYKEQLDNMMQLVRKGMRENQDFGIIPGTQKKTLYDPGAEKLAKYFGLVPSYTLVKEVEDFNTGLFYYRYRCTLTHMGSGKVVGEAERSCNSKEKKYAYKNLTEKYASEEDKKNQIGRFQNSKGYWVLKVKLSPDELAESINTFQSMAQKRAFVEAVKTATMASEIFATGEDEEEAPHAPVTQKEDPIRTAVIARYFSAGQERGFSQEGLKAGAYKRYNVSSMADISNRDINILTEELMTTWDVVPKGEKSKKIGEQVPTSVSVSKEQPKTVEAEIVPEAIASPEKPVKKCAQCKKAIPEGNVPESFCDENCQKAYWGDSNAPTTEQKPWEKWKKKE